MKSFEYVVTDPVGIHARPAGNLSKEAKKYAPAKVFITKNENGKKAEASKLMALMGLGVKAGETITVSIEGGDEEAVAAAMEAYLKANL